MRNQTRKPEPTDNRGGCAAGYHRVVKDEFSALPGVRRAVPGDCWCVVCKQPLAARWNGGRPVALEEGEQ